MQSLARSYTEPMLTVKEVAALRKCSEQHIRAQLLNRSLYGEKVLNERNRPVYQIPLSALDAPEQARYHRAAGNDVGAKVIELPERVAKPLDEYSAYERRQIQFWSELLEEWKEFRDKPIHASLVAANASFAAYATVKYQEGYQAIYGRPLHLTEDTLYRRWRSYKDKDLDGLIEKRGRQLKGVTAMPDIIWEAFLSYYLDESEHSIQKCYEYTRLWLKEKRPDLLGALPSYASFYRRVKNDIPKPLEVLGRKGEKAYRDRCAPYIRRVYDGMESNDYWVADTYTIDVESEGGDGKFHRLYLVAFFDARSGLFTGCHVTKKPSSQATLVALRKAIMKYGIPRNIYVDNGREFLTFDVGGLGHRTKKLKSGEERFEPPAIFQRLGITMINALVRNARAKVIERRFRDIKEHFCRLFQTYTGGNVLERPERLKYVLKKGEGIPSDADLARMLEDLIEGYLNYQEYHGAVSSDEGKARIQVYQENLHTKRMAGEADLNLMLMRSSRKRKIGRRGVQHQVGALKIDYWNETLVTNMFGQEVYYRYDPDNLTEIRLYDLEDRFIMTVPADNEAVCKYGCGSEELKAAVRKVRQVEKLQKEALRNSGLAAYDRISALDLVLEEARRNRERPVPENPAGNVIQLERANETPLLDMAVGYDISTMVENAEQRLEGGTFDE